MKRWSMVVAITAMIAVAGFWTVPPADATGLIDWSSIEITSRHNDPFNDASPGLDIDETWFYWDRSANWFYFAGTIYDPSLEAYGGAPVRSISFTQVLINSIPGGHDTDDYQGADYRLHYTIGAPTAQFDVWNGWDWIRQPIEDADNPKWRAAHSSDKRLLEFGVNADYIEGSDFFVWGLYTDDGGTGTDDFSPDKVNQIGTPTPASMVLMGLALAGVAAVRQRRKSD